MESINERISYIIELKTGGSATRFAEVMGSTPQYINKLVKPGGSVGMEPVSKILRIYPDINARWLILGEGTPLVRSVKEEELRKLIEGKVNRLSDLERYIPLMGDEDLDNISKSLRSGVDPEIDPYKLTAWEAIISEEKERKGNK